MGLKKDHVLVSWERTPDQTLGKVIVEVSVVVYRIKTVRLPLVTEEERTNDTPTYRKECEKPTNAKKKTPKG